MSPKLDARETILSRIRAANGANANGNTAASAWNDIARGYRAGGTSDREAMLELLEDRLHDYNAHVLRSPRTRLPEVIGKQLAERGHPRMIVPPGLDKGLLPERCVFVLDAGFSATDLDGFQGVLTEATLAIAETGTLVLQGVPGQGRRAATLVPDYHLCLVRAVDVVAGLPEAMERLRETATLPTTFVSGPSATSDIEMTRIKGVHGPRFLDVILVEENAGAF